MPGFLWSDYLAVGIFCLSWLGYHFFVEGAQVARGGLNSRIETYRVRWMEQMGERDIRIVDSAIMASLQNGTAFFASTSLLALGGTAALLRGTEDALRMFADLPFGLVTTRSLFEAKVLGLGAIFGYAFFKFAWSYRLFNYANVLLGATPPATSSHVELRRQTAYHTAQMNICAARHFSRGQRAFFLALGYIGWFVSPYIFMISTASILFIMAKRQFSSDARTALIMSPPDDFLVPGD